MENGDWNTPLWSYFNGQIKRDMLQPDSLPTGQSLVYISYIISGD